MRTILTAVLLLAVTSARADWVKVTETRDTVFYADPATMGRKDGIRQVSVMEDYAAPETGGVRSRQLMYDIDCAGERMRSRSVTEHSEPMAQGERVYAWEGESKWTYVAARTGSNIASRAPYRTILRFVCAR